MPDVAVVDSRGMAAASQDRAVRWWLGVALALGAVLRLLAAWMSDPTPGDDVGRLAAACRWAQDPRWLGLSGVWPPFHTYLLGGLIRLGGDPLTWTRVLGFVSTTTALPLFYLAVRELYGDARRAAFATLLLAVYYVHIWMTGTAYAETPYACVLFASLWFVARAVQRPSSRAREALAAGGAMAVAMLLRHEAKLAAVVVLVWLARTGGPGTAFRYAIPPLVVLVWQLFDPAGRSPGLHHDAEVVLGMKIAEVELYGSRAESLRRWILMPAGSPSPIVLALALAGLWMARRAWPRDLWAWLFAVQVVVFLALTVYPGWQPYLRYLFLYVVCLIPHAGLALAAVAGRRPVLAVALVALSLVLQGAAWSWGRNENRPLGWLPVYRAAPQQQVLDRWVRDASGASRVLVVEGYPQAWDAYASVIRADGGRGLSRLRSLSYAERLELTRTGRLDVAGADVVLLDPSSPQFGPAWASLPDGRRVEYRDPRLAIVRLDE